MSRRALLATNLTGLTRAEARSGSEWEVERVLPGLRLTCLATSPHDPGVVFAGTVGDGVLRSPDGGRTWRPAGLEATAVRSLALSPRQLGTLYAGTKPVGLFVSHDEGATWAELEGLRKARRRFWLSPAEPPDFRAYVLGLAVSPSDPAVLLAGIEAGAVVRSGDGGDTWSGHRRRADRDCHELAFHVTDGSWAYEAGGGGPAVSRDAGATWRHHVEGLHGRYCVACAADPERPEVWYVAASSAFSLRHRRPRAHVYGDADARIYRAVGGAAWEALTGGLPQPLSHTPYALLTDPQAPGHVYAGLADGAVWRSTDHGDGWARLPVAMGRIERSMILLP